MPFKKPEIEKHFYSIGEVAEMFNVNQSLVRFWENEFPSLKPHKTNKRNRQFTIEDIEHLRLIYHLVKERGMTLEGARNKIRDNLEDTQNNFEVIKRLQDVRKQLLDIREELEE
ncbi:MAG: MerR family transcriptional regulator [Prolixibacteraceae bacterium]|nr:MerR family transcriptional regulator [Prolixibacteraceae bacterium]